MNVSKPAVKAQENYIHRNEHEFPDPKLVPIDLDRRANNRVHLPAPAFQDDHSEEGIENIEPHDQDEKEKQTGTIPVDVPSLLLILFSAQKLPSPPESIPAEKGGRLLPPVSKASLFHFSPGEISSPEIFGTW